MGMEQTVVFAGAPVPTWPAVRDLLAGHGFPVQLRMIDGELSFPDELPPEAWRELRIGGAQGGMVTLQREPDRVAVVTWGNADAALVRLWNAVTWALAEAGGGRVQSGGDSLTAAEFRRTAEW